MLQYLADHDIRLPDRVRSGPSKGEIRWNRPSHATVGDMLRNLAYVPTVREGRIKGFSVVQWAGIFVPRDAPGYVIIRHNQDINQILVQPELAGKIVQDGGKITPLTAAQFADFIRVDAKIHKDFLTIELWSEFGVKSYSGSGVFAR